MNVNPSCPGGHYQKYAVIQMKDKQTPIYSTIKLILLIFIVIQMVKKLNLTSVFVTELMMTLFNLDHLSRANRRLWRRQNSLWSTHAPHRSCGLLVPLNIRCLTWSS